MLGVVLSGGWADRMGRKRYLTIISAGIVIFAFTFKPLLATGSATTFTVGLWLGLGMLLMGLVFGPMSAVLPEMFPTNVRYTGSGISYNLSSILGAAVAPFIATALVKSFGVGMVGVYLAVVAVITFLGVLAMKETRDLHLHEV